MGQSSSKGAADGSVTADPSIPTMKAWVATGPSASGSNLTNVSLLANVPIPEPTATQARVKVMSASINRVDVGRATSSTCSYPAVLGTDGAGVVDRVGSDEAAATQYNISVGDSVYFHVESGGSGGTFAEYCVVEMSCLTKIDKRQASSSLLQVEGGSVDSVASAVGNVEPDANASAPSFAAAVVAEEGRSVSDTNAKHNSSRNTQHIISYAEAATMPSAAWTAFVALFDKLKIEQGRVIFIDGAAGGVGSYAVQMCKMMGLFVIGTCSTYNVEYLNSLGVDVVVDYVMDDIPDRLREWTQSRGVDYFLELVSPENGERFSKHIRFGGALCLVGGPMKGGASPQQELIFQNQISVHHVNLNGMHRNPITWPLLGYLGSQCVQMVEQKSLTPCYHEVIPFEQGKDALEQFAKGHVKGKIVLRVADLTSSRPQRREKVVPPPILKPASPDSTDSGIVIVDS